MATTMKASKIELLKWSPENGENIEIDWPKVHKAIGIDKTNWLIGQDRTKCQVVLECNDMYCKLVAEFYDKRTLGFYHLMWS